MAKCNEAMGDIVRGDPNRDAVSSDDPDTMTSHFPTEFGKDLHIIIRQCDRVPVAFADVRNGSFYLDQIISCHRTPLFMQDTAQRVTDDTTRIHGNWK